jgi:hypothetical protein
MRFGWRTRRQASSSRATRAACSLPGTGITFSARATPAPSITWKTEP